MKTDVIVSRASQFFSGACFPALPDFRACLGTVKDIFCKFLELISDCRKIGSLWGVKLNKKPEKASQQQQPPANYMGRISSLDEDLEASEASEEGDGNTLLESLLAPLAKGHVWINGVATEYESFDVPSKSSSSDS